MKLPATIKVLDVVYKNEYVNNVSEVDIFKRSTMWGQCDYWTRSIRIFASGLSESDIRQTLWHELLHALCEKLHIKAKEGDLRDDETAIDLLATGINSLLLENPQLREYDGDIRTTLSGV